MTDEASADNKSIETLLVDVKELLDKGLTDKMSSSQLLTLAGMGGRMATHVKNDLDPRVMKERGEKVIYASEFGSQCTRKIWYRINPPAVGETLPLEATARVKFMFGDIIEELALSLAEFSGHKVEGRQQECTFDLKNGWRIRGRIDAVVDGTIVDVKSCSERAFTKYVEQGLTPETDTFGYLAQISVYSAALDNPNVVFWFISKTTGEQHFEGLAPDDMDVLKDAVRKRGDELVDLLSGVTPPDRMGDKPDGKSGNRVLCTTCSYCEYRAVCWPDARTFVYSNGPRYFTVVKKAPKVPEITKEGKLDVPEEIDEATATSAAPEGTENIEEEISDPPF